MTNYELELILIESIIHDQKSAFFKSRKGIKYPVKAYAVGLVNALKLLATHVATKNKPVTVLSKFKENFRLIMHDSELNAIWEHLKIYIKEVCKIDLLLPEKIPIMAQENINPDWAHVIYLPENITLQFIFAINGPARIKIGKNFLNCICESQSKKNNSGSASTPGKTPEEQLKDISIMENKLWEGYPMGKVIEHFQKLTKRKSLNGEFYLTEEQFVSFLKRGFLGDETRPIQKINCTGSEKGKVILLFFLFYDKAVSTYKHPRRKKSFIEFFVYCFDNWEKDTIPPFFKRGKTKETW